MMPSVGAVHKLVKIPSAEVELVTDVSNSNRMYCTGISCRQEERHQKVSPSS